MSSASHTVSLAVGASVADVVATGVPNQLTSGFVSGFAAGYASKKIGRLAMLVAGTGFMAMQYLTFHGYIAVDYDEVGRDLSKILKEKTGGDAVDVGALPDVDESAPAGASPTPPAGGGFGAGFAMGLRSA
jgi:uncharacterized membrane protein (Fun14 family)